MGMVRGGRFEAGGGLRQSGQRVQGDSLRAETLGCKKL